VLRYPDAVRFLVIVLSLATAHAQSLVIRNVTVVDINGARPNSTVYLANGRIAATGKGGKVIDGKGKFLIPGLWDMHVHLWDKEPMANLYVAAGVLGVRDMGSDLKRSRPLQADIKAGRAAGPLIYTSGPPVDGPGSGITQSPVITVTTPEDGRRATDTTDEGLADFVKVLSRVPEDAYFALAQRARVRRIPFAGHLPEAVSITDAIDARQKSMEHLYGLALACTPEETALRKRRAEAIEKKDYAALREIRDRTYATYSPGIATELFRRMARMSVWQTPTLTLRKRLSFMDLDRLAEAPELKYVPEAVRAGWTDPREEAKKATPEQLANFREDYEFHRKLVTAMRATGVPMLAGTDTGDAYVIPGFSLHDELQLLVEAGLSPSEALGAATIQPARYFNLEATHGTVERGKVANLVLLDADPMADIGNTRRISAVIQNGHLLDRKCLDTLLAGTQAPCAFVSSVPKPAPSSVKRPGLSRRRGSRTR
jgi:imidazolonepropionase-like amidohydrolase